MQVVILAAGEGVRMRPLTLTNPKPLLQVGGQTLLDHIFDALPAEIDHAIIVTKYLGEKIRVYCGENFHGRAVAYADGSDQGTAYSFLAAKPLVTDDRFLFLYGDELTDPNDIRAALTQESSIVCFPMDDPWNHGVATVREDGIITSLEEKPEHPTSHLVADGIMVLHKSVFDYHPEKNPKGEYFFTSMVAQYVKDHETVAVISKQGVGGISTPADIDRVDQYLRAHKSV